MIQFYPLYSQLGVVALPLLCCSLIAVTLIIERVIQLALFSGRYHKTLLRKLNQFNPDDNEKMDHFIHSLSQKRALSAKGNAMLLAHRHVDKSLREEVAGLWLQEKRSQLRSGIKILSLIGMISPLFGLLGTVLGLIEMFKDVAAIQGAITPNVLADGLGLAMRTTAVGLMIALPALFAAQVLGLWADNIAYRLEHSLNYTNLWIEGIANCMDDSSLLNASYSSSNNTEKTEVVT